MKYAEKVFKKEFTGDESKDAYLSACKWLATNVISREDEIGEYEFRIQKVKNASQPTFLLTLYASLDEKEVNANHCKICRETHSLFFANSEYNCNSCKMEAYRKRMEERIMIKASFMKDKIKRGL